MNWMNRACGPWASVVLGVAVLVSVGMYAMLLSPRSESVAGLSTIPATDLGAVLCLIGVLACSRWLTRAGRQSA